jgi:hypothetical protein
MPEDEFVTFQFTMASSHPLDVYGGFTASDELLESLAAALNAGSLPIHFNHDLRRPLTVREQRGWTERDDEGFLLVKGEIELLKSDADFYKDQLAQFQAPGGMSYSFTTRLGDTATDAALPAVAYIAGDASHFDEESILAAAAELGPLGEVEGRHLYQFDALMLPVIVLFLFDGAVSVGWNVVSAYLYDALNKVKLKPDTRIQVVKEEGPDGVRVTGTVETSDTEVAKAAIEKFGALLDTGGAYDWDGSKWVDASADPPVESA